MANRGKNPDSWRVGKLEQLFRHTGLFLWSLRGSESNVIITGYSDHWRGAASKGSQIMTSGSNWLVSSDGFTILNGFVIYAHLAAVRRAVGREA